MWNDAQRDTWIYNYGNMFQEYLSTIVATLAKENSEYREIQENIEQTYQEYSNVFEVFDSETPANITERECAALIRIIEWKKQLIKMEIESIYFKGCRDNMEYLKTIGAL